MGHYSQSCKLTGLPITGGTSVALFPMKMSTRLYDNSEDNIRKYGKTSMVSNDGPRLKFIPCMFPILGKYDDYGGIDDIVEDDNTKVIEEYYGLTIKQVVDILTSGRKDDGYDDALNVLKKPLVYPENWIKGESHFNRYQRLTEDKQPPYPKQEGNTYSVSRNGKMVKATKAEYDADLKLCHEQYARYKEWEKTTDPDIENHKNQSYQEKYNDLLSISGMWIHGDVYQQLTNENNGGGYGDRLDLGTPALLEALGFKRLEEKGTGRYNIKFEKDGGIINSDGTWIDMEKEHVFDLVPFQKFCAKKGITIDVTPHLGKGLVHQIYDYVVPSTPYLVKPIELTIKNKESWKGLKDLPSDKLIELFGTDDITELMEMYLDSMSSSGDRSTMMLKYKFLNEDYSSYKVTNPLTEPYFQSAKSGKLKDNLIRFWIFDSYMFNCGKFYDIVGTSPQDGEHKSVLKVLEVAVSILKPVVAEHAQYEDEDEDEE